MNLIKKIKMYTVDKIKQKNSKNDLESSKQDIPENQANMFHVEHKTQTIRAKEEYKLLNYNMKKFEALTINRTEFLFAPNREQAEKMFSQIYGHTAIINEVEKTISE
jgi:hypothetical protein